MASRGRGKGGAAIEPNAGAGILGCKTDNDCRGDAILAHLAHHIGNVGSPVAHAYIDWQAEGLREQAALFLCELRERAGSNKSVTVTNFFDHRFGHRAPTRDIA